MNKEKKKCKGRENESDWSSWKGEEGKIVSET